MDLALHSAVAIAARPITPGWPLNSFIAINPVAHLEQSSFDDSTPSAKVRPIEAYLTDYRVGRITSSDV
ncbi:MAG TPA: hypothetical protein VFQ74_10205, partial [Pseudolysinimonas sp.]|nr:hypothetical protein [Pseudolysinimonas sp.]